MKLPLTITYAIGALVSLSNHPADSPVSCRRLAADGGMPERFLLQVLRNLVVHGLLTSTRGVEGGYCLCRPLSEISLLQVIEAINGPTGPVVPDIPALTDAVRLRLLDSLAIATARQSEALADVSLADISGAMPAVVRDAYA